MNAPELYDSEQVAHLLGCSKRTIWRMVAEGALPEPIRFSRKLVRWDAVKVNEWLAARGATVAPQTLASRTPTLLVKPYGEAPPETQRLYKAAQIARMLALDVNVIYVLAKKYGWKRRPIGNGYLITDEQMAQLQSLRVIVGTIPEAKAS